MASLIYNSAIDDTARGAINFNIDTFKVMLVTSSYSPDKDAHLKRSSVTNEVSGTGYTAGGTTVTCTVTKNVSTDQTTLSFSAPSWPNSTFTTRGAVYYKSRGGASSADELIFYNDFQSNLSPVGATFTIPVSVITLQN